MGWVMKYIIILVCLAILTLSLNANDNTENNITEIPKEKSEKIYELFELTNIKIEAEEVIDELFYYFNQLAPNLPDGYIDGMKSEFDPEGYLNKLAPIYDKAFSENELQLLIDFFGSDIGKKWISKRPEISTQSYEVMMEWQAELAVKLREKIEKDGYLNTLQKKSGEENE
jgi:hypothetical protein